ncbi:hypothetical protein BH23THE1_BH23THE1_28410 [soil metagenome]
MDRNFFDFTLNYNWDMVPVDRSFDPNKIKEYLSQIERENDLLFIKELLEKTTYVDYAKFKQALLDTFELFKQSIGQEEFYLMLPKARVGSEHWLTALLWAQLRRLNLKKIINETNELTEHMTNILIIDDAIYSGQRIIERIYMFGETMSSKNVKCHIVTPFASSPGFKLIDESCKDYDIECILHYK